MFRGIFRISLGDPQRRRFVAYRDSFQMRLETFVVHRTPRSARHWTRDGWRVSHRRTGFRALGYAIVADRQIYSDYATPREAKRAAVWVLMHGNNATVAEAVAKAEGINRA